MRQRRPKQRESSEASVVQWACDFPAGVLRGSSATLTTSLSWCVPGSDRGGSRGNTHQLKFSSPKELPVLIGLLTVCVCVCVYAACTDARWTFVHRWQGCKPWNTTCQSVLGQDGEMYKCMWKRAEKRKIHY